MSDESPRPLPPVLAMLPDLRNAVRFAATAVLAWVTVRLALEGMRQFAPAIMVGPQLHPLAALMVVGVVAAAVALDERRRREVLFYANVGVPPVWAATIGAVVAGVLEIGAGMVLGSGG